MSSEPFLVGLPGRGAVRFLEVEESAFAEYDAITPQEARTKMDTIRHERLTPKDLIITSDGRSARYGFLKFRIIRSGEHESEWRWVDDSDSYFSAPFRRVEDAPEYLVKVIQKLSVSISVH